MNKRYNPFVINPKIRNIFFSIFHYIHFFFLVDNQISLKFIVENCKSLMVGKINIVTT